MRSGDPVLGEVYRCPICGAELSVIRASKGDLAPVCCNRRMEPLVRINTVYYCPLCGSELMIIRDGRGRPEPICCDQRMRIRGMEHSA